MDIVIPKTRQANVRKDGHRVVILLDGQRAADLPWEAALELAKGITVQARRIEEEIKAEQIVLDQALLIRTGAPIGLSSNPAILNEAGKEAVYNSELRRYFPDTSGIGAINSRGIVGRPTLIKHKGRQNGQ